MGVMHVAFRVARGVNLHRILRCDTAYCEHCVVFIFFSVLTLLCVFLCSYIGQESKGYDEEEEWQFEGAEYFGWHTAPSTGAQRTYT